MRLCVVTFKKCWQDDSGVWLSSGGFPLQMSAIGSLFDEMTLVVTRGEKEGGGIQLPGSAEVVPLRNPAGRGIRRKVSVLTHLPYYLREIRRNIAHADVVHTPLPGDIPLLGMVMVLLNRKRLIARYCSSWSTTSETTLANRVTRSIMRVFAVRRNLMLATGEDDVPPGKGIEWIFATALSADELATINADTQRGLAERPELVYVGRLSREKGVDLLIEAIASLERKGFRPMPTVTIIGDGPERGALEAMIRQLVCEAPIHLTGQLNRDELSRHLARADLCVQPSRTESFGKASLDAMAHGVPVLRSDVGAARAVVGKYGERGWLVPPGHGEALAGALENILTQPRDWPSLRRRCRSYAEGYTLERWTRSIGQMCAERWGMSVVAGKLRP